MKFERLSLIVGISESGYSNTEARKCPYFTLDRSGVVFVSTGTFNNSFVLRHQEL
jgi:hypothetical protein